MSDLFNTGHIAQLHEIQSARLKRNQPGIGPEVEALKLDDASFPLLVLVETRIGLKCLCDLGSFAFGENDEILVPHDDRHTELKQPTWIRIQDGRKNRKRSVNDCRKTFVKNELGLTALQGVCAYLQHSTVVSEWTKDGAHVMDLSGSVHRDYRGFAAYLSVHDGRPELSCYWSDRANPKYGSASRREC